MTPTPTDFEILPPPPSAKDVHAAPTTIGSAPSCAPASDDTAKTQIEVGRRWHEPLEGVPTAVQRVSARRAPAAPPPPPPSPAPVVAPQLAQPPAAPVEPTPNAPTAEPGAAAVEPPGPPPGWATQAPRRRPWPRAVKLAVLAVLLLLVLLVVGGRSAPPPAARTTSLRDLEGQRAVHDEELRDRKEITPDHFQSATPMFIPVAPEPTSGESLLGLEERQRRRDDNPEDIRTARRPHPPGRVARPKDAPAAPHHPNRAANGVILVDWRADLPGDAAESTSPTRARARDREPTPLLAAGDIVKATLSRPLVLRGPSAVVTLEVVDGPLPPRSRLVGRATAANDGVVSIRVTTLVLPDDHELRVDAEVFDGGGGVGIVGSVRGGEDSSVASAVADGTVRRAASTFLGDGLVGGAADDALRARDHGRTSNRRTVTVSVPRGRIVTVLFARAVVNDRR